MAVRFDKPQVDIPSLTDLMSMVDNDPNTVKASSPETPKTSKATGNARGLKVKSTTKELAEQFGVSEQTIKRRLKKLGYDTKQKERGVDRTFNTKTKKFEKAMSGLLTVREQNISSTIDLSSIYVNYLSICKLFGFKDIDTTYGLQLFEDLQYIYCNTGKTTETAEKILAGLSTEYKDAFKMYVANNYS